MPKKINYEFLKESMMLRSLKGHHYNGIKKDAQTFGVSDKTYNKIFKEFKQQGLLEYCPRIDPLKLGYFIAKITFDITSIDLKRYKELANLKYLFSYVTKISLVWDDEICVEFISNNQRELSKFLNFMNFHFKLRPNNMIIERGSFEDWLINLKGAKKYYKHLENKIISIQKDLTKLEKQALIFLFEDAYRIRLEKDLKTEFIKKFGETKSKEILTKFKNNKILIMQGVIIKVLPNARQRRKILAKIKKELQ
ncbi:hypothetical protein KY347_04075 [Candidatus Woesearchaeota archaeon]|nr:hypothetical protein [Candidatus Woesearchaeota archaeon]